MLSEVLSEVLSETLKSNEFQKKHKKSVLGRII